MMNYNPNMEGNNNLIMSVTQLVMGADYSVDLKVDWKYGSELGIPLQDIGAIADSRLNLRCLLPLPYPHDITNSVNPIDDLAQLLDEFQESGWEVRIAESGGRLVTSLIIDDKSVIFREKLNATASFRYSEESSVVNHYKDQFENYWNTALETVEFDTLYRSRIVAHPEEVKELLVFSSDTWTKLIRSLVINPASMFKISPRKFEELVAELLIREGMRVTLTPATRDGGRDILAVADTPIGQQLYLTECKRYTKENPVDVTVVRSLYGVVTQENASAGLIVTTSRFTSDAIRFAEPIQYRMELRDFKSLLNWLKKHVR